MGFYNLLTFRTSELFLVSSSSLTDQVVDAILEFLAKPKGRVVAPLGVCRTLLGEIPEPLGRSAIAHMSYDQRS